MINYFIRTVCIFILVTGILFHSIGCKLIELDDPETLTITDVIKIETTSSQVNANGVDKVTIIATLLGDTPDGQNVIFTTDAGTFASIPGSGTTSENQQQIEIKAVGKTAEVYLVSSIEVKEANVSASIEGYTVFTTIKFVRFYPERMYLTSNMSRLKADGQSTATLTATLIPPDNKGTVSKGTRVIFDAIDLDTNAPVPQLHREALSDENGQAAAQFASQQAGVMQITCSIDKRPDITPATFVIEFYEEDDNG